MYRELLSYRPTISKYPIVETEMNVCLLNVPRKGQ